MKKHRLSLATVSTLIAVLSAIAILVIKNILVVDYDSIIFNEAKEYVEYSGYNDPSSNPFILENRSFAVTKEQNDDGFIYYANVNGKENEIDVPFISEDNRTTVSNLTDLSDSEDYIATKSLKRIRKYIKSSKILKDKDEILNFIEGIKIQEADFSNEEENMNNGAMFYPEDEAIYINRYNREYVCEWMLVHEYVHAISYYTNGHQTGIYSHNYFNELLTDVITASMNPKISKDIQSEYYLNSYLIYPYINLFNEKAIEAYFYGYTDIYKEIPKDELDFFVLVLENYGMQYSVQYYNNIVYKWYMEDLANNALPFI